MANETENLNLSLQTLGDVPFKRAYRANMQKIDAAVGGVANVEAGDDGLAAGTVQEALQALATRIQALEDAAAGA